jgi:hypothetical protein
MRCQLLIDLLHEIQTQGIMAELGAKLPQQLAEDGCPVSRSPGQLTDPF